MKSALTTAVRLMTEEGAAEADEARADMQYARAAIDRAIDRYKAALALLEGARKLMTAAHDEPDNPTDEGGD